MLKQDDFVRSKLVEVGWRFGQAYQGGHICGQMVMAVIANRQKCGWGNWLNIIDGIPSFMAEAELPPLKYPQTLWDGAFVKLLHAVDGIFEGSAQDLSKGALYFADSNKIERPWFKEKILEPIDEFGMKKHNVVANMNNIMFFK